MSTPKIGLTKPQLLALPKPEAPRTPSQTKDYFFSMSARVDKIGKATVVHVGLFWVKTRELIAEIFINPSELCDVTYNVTLNKWSNAQLGNYISENIPDRTGKPWIILLKKLHQLKVGADVLTSRIVTLPPKVLMRLIMTYTDEQSKIGALPSNLIRDYPDYYKELVLLGRDIRDTSNLFPNRFRERHTQLSAELSIKKDKITSKAVASRYTAERGLYEHKGKEYAVLMPRSAKEIVMEGKTLGHCVATYAERHASSETTILFLREQADIKRPFATAEVRNGRLIQLRTTRNDAPPDTARKFFERYIERVLIPRLNKIDEERQHA